MTAQYSALERLSDDELVTEVMRLAASVRQATAALIASLSEFDSRRLYLGAGCSSLFTYCTQVLALSEDAAYFRIEAARAARRFPVILGHLADGAITLTAVKLLAPHLTDDNHLELLDAARGRSKRQVEEMVARLQPRPDVPPVVRKLPATRGISLLKEERSRSGRATGNDRAAETAREAAAVSAPVPVTSLVDQPSSAPPIARSTLPAARQAVVAPLAPQRYKVQMTVSAETHAKLRRAQDLLRHAIPDGDPAAVFDRALTVLLEQLDWQLSDPDYRRDGFVMEPGSDNEDDQREIERTEELSSQLHDLL